MVFLPSLSLSPIPCISRAILGLPGITYTLEVSTIVGVEDNDEPASLLSSVLVSCPYILQVAEPQSSEVDQKLYMSEPANLLPQYIDKVER